MSTLDELTDRIRRAAASGAGAESLGKTLKLDLKGEGFIHIDGASVTNDDKPADLVVTIARRDLEALGRGELDPMRAMMTGRMKLSDMGLAMRLQPQIRAIFSQARDA
jgi:putative sterol carrier protein